MSFIGSSSQQVGVVSAPVTSEISRRYRLAKKVGATSRTYEARAPAPVSYTDDRRDSEKKSSIRSLPSLLEDSSQSSTSITIDVYG